MTDSKQRKIGAIMSYASVIINTLVTLVFTPFLIRSIGQSEYGLYSLVASIIGYLTIMDLGFGNAIIVYTAKYRAQGNEKDEKKLHGMFNLVFKVIGIIAGLLGVILYFNVGNMFGSKMTDIELQKMQIMMLILSFNLFLTFYFAIYNSVISAYEKFTFQKIVAIISSLLKPLLMIPLLFLGYKSISLCIIITIVNIMSLFSNYLFCTKKLNINAKFLGFDSAMFKTIFRYSMWIFLGAIVDKINWSIDNFVLGAVSGTIAVSIYSIAATLNQLFISLSTAISSVLLPKMSKLVAKKTSPKELTDEMIKVGRIQYFVIFLMFSALVLFGKTFILIWAGAGFEESYYVSLILIMPLCIPLIQNLGISIRQAMNKHKFAAIVNICVAVLNLIISIFLAKCYGAIGAAFGTGIGILLSIIITNIYYYKIMKLDVIRFWEDIILVTFKLFISIIAILMIMHFTKLNGLYCIIVNGILFIIIYLFVLYRLVMNDYEKSIINKILKIRRK